MKQTIFVLMAALLMCCLPTRTNASNTAGMDLSLTCVGGNNYLIRMVYYRDCNGPAAPATAAFVIECLYNPTLNFNVTGVPQAIGSGVQAGPVCSSWSTTCNGGTLYGIQQYIYETQVTLPPCAQWRIGWSGIAANLNGHCCRNQSGTLINPTSQKAYTEITLNNLVATCISTPVYTNLPIAGLCIGQTQCVDFGGIDPDGDSLTYDLVSPMTNGNNGVVNWMLPFSPTNPFMSTPPVQANPVLGTVCMSPTSAVTGLMTLRIRKWRSVGGQPIELARVYRDIQVTAYPCNNQPPVLGGMDTTLTNGYSTSDSLFYAHVCIGDTLKFALWGYDPDIPNPSWGEREKFEITWNQGIANGSFQAYHNHTDSAYAIFTWVPMAMQAGKTHQFSATIRDGACPFNGTRTYQYQFTVGGAPPDLGVDTLLCKGESVTFYAGTTYNPWICPTYIWYFNGVPILNPFNDTMHIVNSFALPPGQYVVSIETGDGLYYSSCKGMDSAIITVVPLPQPDLGNDTLLHPSVLSLTLDAGPGGMYLWSTGDSTQQITVTTTGQYWVIVDGGYGTRCTAVDGIYVEWLIGINDPQPSNPLMIFPNPTFGDITLALSEFTDTPLAVKIWTTQGQEMLHQQIPNDSQNKLYTFNIGHLPPGVYLIIIETSSGRIASRVVLE
jgi:hypothetical protein